jgi:2-amino-4-hydroxy-6-hydroxymethyldihydropteridine diphosphokinase
MMTVSTIVYIGLGSNLSEPIEQVKKAIKAIEKIVQSEVISVSSLYLSKPMGPQEQENYINGVLALKTSLSAIELLDALQAIENEAGRVRKENRWGARILDLDIILFGNEIINTERLTIPHYGMSEREFVLMPLAEIAPQLQLPNGQKITFLSNSIANNEMIKLS